MELAVTYLYNAGDQYTSLTGGWTTLETYGGSYDDGYRAEAPTITNGSSSMTIVQVGSTYRNGGMAYVANAIDLTNYDTLYFKGSILVNDDWDVSKVVIGVWTSLPAETAWYTSTLKTSTTISWSNGVTSSGTYSVDVSSLSGSYYLGLFIHAHDATVMMTSMWLR